MYGQKVAEALQGLCAVAGCSCGLRRSCNDSFPFNFLIPFNILLVTLPGLSISLSILLAFQSTLRLAVDFNFLSGLIFIFLSCWHGFVSFCCYHVIITKMMSLVDVVYFIYLFLYLF